MEIQQAYKLKMAAQEWNARIDLPGAREKNVATGVRIRRSLGPGQGNG